METCEVKRKWALHFKDGPLKKVFTAQVMIPMQEGNNNRIKKCLWEPSLWEMGA